MSFRDEVLTLLKNKAADMLGTAAADLSETTRFQEDLHCKSADIVRFTAALEDEYEAEVPFMAFNRCATLGDAADYMCRVMGLA